MKNKLLIICWLVIISPLYAYATVGNISKEMKIEPILTLDVGTAVCIVDIINDCFILRDPLYIFNVHHQMINGNCFILFEGNYSYDNQENNYISNTSVSSYHIYGFTYCQYIKFSSVELEL